MILAYLLILSPYLSASFDPDLTEGVVIPACLLVVCANTSQPVLWSRFDRDCCDASKPSDTIPIPLSQFWSRFDRRCCDSSVPAGSMPILLSQFWSRFDRDCCDSTYLLILAQYLSVSLDPDLTDGVVILAYLLRVLQTCQPVLIQIWPRPLWFSHTFWYYLHTSQSVLIQIWPMVLWFSHTFWEFSKLVSQFWSRFDRDCCDSRIPSDTISIPVSQSWSRFDRRCCDSSRLAGCMPIFSTQFWSRLDWDCCDSGMPSDTIPIPLSQSWSRFDRRCCDSSVPAGSMLILPSQFWSRFDRRRCDSAYLLVVNQNSPPSLDPVDRDCCDSSIPFDIIPIPLSASLDPDLTETAVILAHFLVLSPYLDPDLMEGVVILAAYLLVVYASTSQPVLIQIWTTLLWC